MSTKRISVVDRREAERINALRLAEYATAQGFAVQAPGIVWNASDDQSTILAAWDGDELVSTLRVELIDEQKLIEAKIECPWDFPLALELPALVLSKMATQRAYRKVGLNEVLRHIALSLGREWGAKQVIGTFVAGSPRRAAMADMGYHFFENRLGWNTVNYESKEPVLVAMLDLATHGQQALDVCQKLAGDDALATWAFDGERPARRFVEVVR